MIGDYSNMLLMCLNCLNRFETNTNSEVPGALVNYKWRLSEWKVRFSE